MAAGIFTIEELTPGGGERFEWTNDRRSAPLQPWDLSGKLRTVRTDYPGATTPTEQVLGPSHQPFTLRGRWDDRYNAPGFAVAEMRRFEDMARRGNLCRVQFQAQAFVCLFTGWQFSYRRAWEIRYEITASVHDRPEDHRLDDRSPKPGALSAEESFGAIDIAAQALEESFDRVNAQSIGRQLYADTEGQVAGVAAARRELADTLDQGALGEVTSDLAAVASKMRAVRTRALDLVDGLIEARSDTELAIRNATSVLDFEEWARSLRFHARLVMGAALKGAEDAEARNDPAPHRVYRPHEGESLYAIARKFYGTPDAWHLIAKRNRLAITALTGNELLIIPERAA